MFTPFSFLGVLSQTGFLILVSPPCVIRGSPPPRECPEHRLISLADQTRMFLGKDPLGILFLRLIWCIPPPVSAMLTKRTPAQIVRHLQFSYTRPGAIFVSYGSRDEENSTNFSSLGRSRAFFSAEYTLHFQTSLRASWMYFRVDFPAGPLSFSLKSPPTVLKQFQPEVSMRR